MATTDRLTRTAAVEPLVSPATLLRIAIILTVLAIWESLAHSGWFYRDVVPSLFYIGKALYDLLSHGDYYFNLGVTAAEIGAALLIGGTLALKGGVQTYVSRTPMGLAIVAALAVAALCGLWNGLLVARVGMQPIIATLILMVAGRGIAQLITNGQIITVYYAPYFFIGNGFLLGLPFAVFIAALVWGLLHLLMTRTALGLFIQAIGINPAAARLAGVPERLITVCVYVFCGFAAGVAGLIVSSNVKSADGNNAGLLLELDAILAVTLGGTLLTGGRFSLAGSVLGALIIQTLTSTIYSIGVPPEINLVVKAAVVFVVMLLQSAEFRAALRGWVRRAPLPGGIA